MLGSGGEKRSPLSPHVPTIAESGVPGYVSTGWAGLMLPKGTAKPVFERIYGSLDKMMKDANTRDLFMKQGGILPVVGVPLPAGAVALDSTWYDLLDMGSMGHHIEVGADGRVHVTWQDEFCELGGGCPPNLAAPQPHPNRGMAYAVRDVNGVWSNLGKVTDTRLPTCCIRDLPGGFGSLAITPSGGAAIAQHLNEDGCDLHGYFHLEDAPGSSAFRGYLTPIVSPSLLFPQVAASPNGSFTRRLARTLDGSVFSLR